MASLWELRIIPDQSTGILTGTTGQTNMVMIGLGLING